VPRRSRSRLLSLHARRKPRYNHKGMAGARRPSSGEHRRALQAERRRLYGDPDTSPSET
jgi:hypothetical protein